MEQYPVYIVVTSLLSGQQIIRTFVRKSIDKHLFAWYIYITEQMFVFYFLIRSPFRQYRRYFEWSGISRISASPARTQAANIREKRVVSVMVEEDDSIWSIAKQYYTEECGSMKDYIAEIKKCNSISSDTIYAGYPLLVPVWASDAELPALEEGSL